MNQDQIDGMQARSRGEKKICFLSGSRKDEWLKGYEVMETHINNALKAAKQMHEQITALRKQPQAMRLIA
jgi:lipid A disaccharide synthetase